MVFIQYIFGIRSMRQTIKEIETNVAYRWFLGFGLDDKIPHFSTFGKNYARRCRCWIQNAKYCEEASRRRDKSGHALQTTHDSSRLFPKARVCLWWILRLLRWTNLKGLEKNSMQTMLVFAAMNLKKLATWHWRNTKPTVPSPKNQYRKTKTPLSIISQRRFVYGLKRELKGLSFSSLSFNRLDVILRVPFL